MRLAVLASGDGAGQAYMSSGVSLTPLGSPLQLCQLCNHNNIEVRANYNPS
jgi:hypothetical protein